jgi:predicted acetyltransferase
MALELRLPTLDEEEEFLRAYRAAAAEEPSCFPLYERGMSLSAYLQLLAELERGASLRPYLAPATVLFAYIGNRIVGEVSIRHYLNDFLRRIGGHIGYSVVPEFRRRGYGTEMLRQSLMICRQRFAVERVLLICDDDNLASIGVIEKCGGVLEAVSRTGNKALRKYWIDTTVTTAPTLR